MPLPPGLQMAWNQLSHHLGHHHQIPEATIRAWRLSLLSGNTRCSGTCQPWMRATCNECGHTRCSFSFCPDYLKPCNTCQTIPPSPSSEQGMKTGPATTLSNDFIKRLYQTTLSNDFIKRPTPGGKALHRGHLGGRARLGSRR